MFNGEGEVGEETLVEFIQDVLLNSMHDKYVDLQI
jgi:hypothetical protein